MGYRFVTRVDEAIETIAENPKMFAAVIGEARRVLVEQFPYAIDYKVKPDGVLAIGCLHHKRDTKVAVSRANKPEPN